jgi:hypothetical protein
MQTDMTKLTATLRNFANTPKNALNTFHSPLSSTVVGLDIFVKFSKNMSQRPYTART